MECVLGVFAKHPQPGQVKTRLAATFGADEAARLYEAFLRDFLPRLDSVPARRVLAYTPATARDFFHGLAGSRFELAEQHGVNLGARMQHFFEEQFARGSARIVLVGSDTPDLPMALIEQAFAELDRRDIVFGPCDDGGYYLVGMSRMVPQAFEEVNWAGPKVLMQTIERVSELALRFSLLERWYDIDRADDVSHLCAQIGAARHAGRDPGLPHTEAALRSLATLL